jgi:hypothetical protein
MPADIDEFLARDMVRNSNGVAYREYQVEGKQRALIFRLRRSVTLVVPGTIALEIPWNWLELKRAASGPLRPSAFQVFAHAVAHVANAHPKFRSVMLGDARVREYDHVNMELQFLAVRMTYWSRWCEQQKNGYQGSLPSRVQMRRLVTNSQCNG